MIVVSFKEFTPTPRYDTVPWHHITIEEAATGDGPWTLIDNQNILPLDADPANPAPRNFTTDNATLAAGWYRIIFFDAGGNEALPVDPIHNVGDADLPFLPTASDVGQLIMSRTKDNNGNEIGTFSGLTRPTFTQVMSIIANAADDVTMLVDTDIPEGAYEDVERAIALKAAMTIERSYFAEQIANNRSPYAHLKEEYDTLVGTADKPGLLFRAVEREAEEAATGEKAATNSPSYSFPDPDLRYGIGRPL